MAKGITKRQKAVLVNRAEKKTRKAARMHRGDQNSETSQESEATTSESEIRKARLKSLSEAELEQLVLEKCLGSNIYFRESISDEEIKYNHNGFSADYGICLQLRGSLAEHHFGFEMMEHGERGNIIRIHYAKVSPAGDHKIGDTRLINPKKFSARNLVDIAEAYRHF
tara:strand:- start:2657 stop:3160 length:504 start_codon:yes stop_codon:yes gene_type:complete